MCMIDNFLCFCGYHRSKYWHKVTTPYGTEYKCPNCFDTIKYDFDEKSEEPEKALCEDPKPVKIKIYENRLSIFFNDGRSTQLWVYDTNYPSLIDPWKKFYKWFFTNQSPYYALVSKNIVTVILRSDIKYFTIEIKEKEM